MKKLIAAAGLAVFLFILTSSAAIAQSRAMKVLEGKVLGNGDAPLVNAIVYLQDSKDSSIRSFITTDDGSYRFGQISPDIDYQVWAQYKNLKSGSKTVSSFDSRKVVTIDFHIKADK
jgi:Carboxypeptidase regulatory-like domain